MRKKKQLAVVVAGVLTFGVLSVIPSQAAPTTGKSATGKLSVKMTIQGDAGKYVQTEGSKKGSSHVAKMDITAPAKSSAGHKVRFTVTTAGSGACAGYKDYDFGDWGATTDNKARKFANNYMYIFKNSKAGKCTLTATVTAERKKADGTSDYSETATVSNSFNIKATTKKTIGGGVSIVKGNSTILSSRVKAFTYGTETQKLNSEVTVKIDKYNETDKKWENIGQTVTTDKGKYSYTVKPGATAKYRARFVANTYYDGSKSGTKKVTVTPKD